ncbi:MAG: tellurite resistance TerB family protein [Alphaproteobacteria bacterium]|nr:tellurite resistance TerB family protein [Alphaproteobacteria bacterium]MBU0796363.1 tellurite resistance TerB family protein [Alphaproteobacteria bacterium]MBU0888604.1 tellurite resistance TerB family protein [Alphaproteobacteria bacterium]MBU1813662.1 tellurite resistance TerB family protein [Alphaproteobacteria bacterium]
MISHHTALIYVMVLVSAADSDMTDAEFSTIGEIVTHLPVFRDFEVNNLPSVAASCGELLQGDNGLDTALDLIKGALPARLCETAYALACDVVASDGQASQEELRMLEMLRHRINVDRLVAAAIERGARARYTAAMES